MAIIYGKDIVVIFQQAHCWLRYVQFSIINLPRQGSGCFQIFNMLIHRSDVAEDIRYLKGDNSAEKKWRNFCWVTKISPDEIFPSKVYSHTVLVRT